jgi:glycosyltransferase involved in cell wall biosynthesis
VGGVPDVVADGETGYLVKAGGVEEMAEAIIELLMSPEKAREMGSAGREAVYPRFAARTLIANVEGLYAELLRRKRK